MSSATVQPIRKKRRPVSKRSTASARDARERIILTALELFSQFGYDAVSTIKIANAVGVSQPNIHYHFRSKRKLWEAAMFELADQIKDDALLSGQVTSIGDDALAQLKLVCSQTVRNSWRYPLLGRVVLLEGQAGGERLNWLIDNVLQEHYADIRSLIEACVEQGLIKPHDPAQLIMLLHGAASTFFNVAPLVESAFERQPFDRDQAKSFQALFMDVIFSGLSA